MESPFTGITLQEYCRIGFVIFGNDKHACVCIIDIAVLDSTSSTAFNGHVTTPIIINADTNAVEVKAKEP